jgi:hypothetical protein
MKELLSRPGILASYPYWYQLLLVVWLLLSAVLVAGFLLVKPVADVARTGSTSDTQASQSSAVPPPIDGQLRLLTEVENDLPIKRMPVGARGYAFGLSDISKVSRESKEWTLEINRRTDGSFWATGHVSSETKAKFDRWQSDQSISDLHIFMFTSAWEEAREKISIPLAFVVSGESFDFRKLSKRHEIYLSKKSKSAGASKQK